MIKTVLFDLDGTFADTAADLAYALNMTLQAHGKTPLSFAEIRPVVSHGARALIELGFQLHDSDPAFTPIRQQLLDIYADNIALHTRLFAGMESVLQALLQRNINWGIVTNKPANLTIPLMQALGLHDQASCIVSGDTLPQRKPDPAPLLHACTLAGSPAQQCVYVGDAERDIVAGERAGMHTLVALFGYIGATEHPEQWGADAMITEPQAIVDWIDTHNQRQVGHG